MRFFVRLIGILFVITVTVVGVIFAMANREPFSLYFLHYISVELPTFAWVYLSFVSGLLVGLICMVPKVLGARRRATQAQTSAIEKTSNSPMRATEEARSSESPARSVISDIS